MRGARFSASRFWVVALAASALLAAAPGREPGACVGPTPDWSAPDEVVRCSGDLASAPPEGAVGRLFGIPLDANRADAASLETLPSIGPARADAWILERRRGPLRSWRDLERIPGIGEKRAAALRDELCFGDCACGVGRSC